MELIKAVRDFCKQAVAHDPWVWRTTCESILANIDYSAPYTIGENEIHAMLLDGRYIDLMWDETGRTVRYGRAGEAREAVKE